MKFQRFIWLLFGVSLLFLISCRQPESPPDPAEIVQQTAVRMNEMSGFHFVIERTGAPAFVDPPDNVFAFRRAEGDYRSPDRARATVRIIGPGLITDVQVISVADIQWQTNPLTGNWEELPPNWGFDPTVLFDEEVGLPTVLTEDISNLILLGVEGVPDGPNGRFYHLSGTLAGERLYQMSGTLIGPQTVEAELWITPDTFELVRTIITEPESEANSIWQVDFSNYDQAVDIQPPTE